MCVRIVGVQQHKVAVFVHLLLTHLILVFLNRRVLAIKVLQQRKTYRFLVELLVGEHSELDEHLDVVPFLCELVFVGFVEFCQLVSHFLGDVAGDLFHVIVALQVRPADVQRDVRTVDHTVQQRQIFRHNVLHLIGHIHLVAIQLDLVAVYIQVALDLREVQNTREVKRIIHIQVNMEQRLLELHRIEFMVELVIVLVLQLTRLACPRRVDIVDDVLFVQLHFLAVFPFFLLAESDLDGQELTVFLQEALNRRVLQILTELIVDMQHDIGASL